MKAGPLRQVIEIERPLGTLTDSGAVRDDFTPFLLGVSAAIEHITGSERWVQSQQISADITTRIRIRWRETVNETMRVLHRRAPGSPTLIDIYDIQAAVPADDRKTELHLLCIRRTADGFRSGEPINGGPPVIPPDTQQITFDRDDITFDRPDITFDQTEG